MKYFLKKSAVLFLLISVFALIFPTHLFAAKTCTISVNAAPISCSGGNPPAQGCSNGVTIIGDSVTQGAQSRLKQLIPQATIDAAVSRQWSQGVSVLSNIKSAGNLKPVLIFALGTNGPITQSQIQNVKDIAAGSTIIIMTVYGPSWSGANNGIIRSASGVRVADWNALASLNPGWFTGDPQGVHPNSAGSNEFAQLLASTAGCTNTPEPTAPANNNTCGGFYTNYISKNPDKVNFGDPSCTLLSNKNKIYDRLKQLDPANADYWFLVVTPCESSYISNAYLGPQGGTPDPNGAWGLFQMGSDRDGDGKGRNGVYDRGDVVWETQISNAVTYNNGRNWGYWACACDRWRTRPAWCAQ